MNTEKGSIGMSELTALPLEMSGLEKILGYSFKNKALLSEALTHSSYINEHKKDYDGECNERLEFLGDSVLSIVVSDYLFSRYSSRQEGDLTKIRASVVCEKALAKYAGEISLGDYLRMGNGEEKNNGRSRTSIISDAFEAVLGAFYIDSEHNTGLISEFLLPFIKKEIEYINREDSFIDYKTALQQIVQQAEGEKLEYIVVGEEGPDHDKTFAVEARLNSNVIGKGKGASKREAELAAAKEALALFGGVSEKV